MHAHHRKSLKKVAILAVSISTTLLVGIVIISSYLVQRPKNIMTGLGAIPGDVNSDGVVDIIDFQLLSNSFGRSSGQSGYNVSADFNHDNVVDILDFQVLSNNFGHTGTTTNTPTIRQNTPTPGGATPTSPTGYTYDQLYQMVINWKNTHTGNGGKDWDINAKTNAQIESDPALKALVTACGDYHIVRPVFPLIAWEYGGADHPWIHPEASALVYCVYIPVQPNTSHWSYTSSTNRVNADVYVKFPDQNPCKNEVGKYQVLNCLGDSTNSEVLVDTASLRDGHDVGLELSLSSSELFLILSNGTKVSLLLNI